MANHSRTPIRNLLPLLVLPLVTACAPQTFTPAEGVIASDSLSNEISSNFFKMSDGQASFQQEELDQNKTSVSFQVQGTNGNLINNLTQADVIITENGVPISQFQFSSNSQQIVQTVDIVFAVDITGSMSPTIESAKTRLINFVNTSRAQGYHTRMCLITFGDYTVQNCSKFYDNDPKDPATMSQVNELISEISKLKALTGAQDPGGSDLAENPMRALIDASKAPWATSSQRFLILVTDDKFLYSPGNSGAVGPLAPTYTEVQQALQTSQMKVFAVTPSLAGYDKPFKGTPGIVALSQGEFFKFSDLMNGAISLDTILARIMVNVKTTYLVEYTVDEIPGLNPSLPLSQRNIKVELKNTQTGTVVPVSIQSNVPNGQAQYKKKWKLSDKIIKAGSVRVKVNGVVIPYGFSIEAGELIFDLPPIRGVKIEVIFKYDLLKDAVQFTPIVLGKNEDLNALRILFNDQVAKGPDVSFERSLEGHWMVRPTDRVLGQDDPFGIRQKGGLSIKILRVK